MRRSIVRRSAAAMTQLQQRSAPTATARQHGGKHRLARCPASGGLGAVETSHPAQQLPRLRQRADIDPAASRRGESAVENPTPQQQQRRETIKSREQNTTPQQQQRRQQLQSATPAQRQQTVSHLRASALSGNESRALPASAAGTGRQSRQFSSVNREQRDGARERLSEHHELRRR